MAPKAQNRGLGRVSRGCPVKAEGTTAVCGKETTINHACSLRDLLVQGSCPPEAPRDTPTGTRAPSKRWALQALRLQTTAASDQISS